MSSPAMAFPLSFHTMQYFSGPNLSKVRYPRDVCSPRYMCPHCSEQFLFHRLRGAVACPFCYNRVSVGYYVSSATCFRVSKLSPLLFVKHPTAKLRSEPAFTSASVQFNDNYEQFV
ncbi:unnamed protein product [Heligmosomoides polygyrus]|uniref:Uncharacterized protein n=1 Tax=Heligmosomoides polygyrus TaxID=6339 RepID=A0A3P7WNR6_HELPZ|nr:unnamed protein product [Heligmosomoides polygyrus]